MRFCFVFFSGRFVILWPWLKSLLEIILDLLLGFFKANPRKSDSRPLLPFLEGMVAPSCYVSLIFVLCLHRGRYEPHRHRFQSLVWG